MVSNNYFTTSPPQLNSESTAIKLGTCSAWLSRGTTVQAQPTSPLPSHAFPPVWLGWNSQCFVNSLCFPPPSLCSCCSLTWKVLPSHLSSSVAYQPSQGLPDSPWSDLISPTFEATKNSVPLVALPSFWTMASVDVWVFIPDSKQVGNAQCKVGPWGSLSEFTPSWLVHRLHRLIRSKSWTLTSWGQLGLL